jgi:hypothetical protein
MQIDHNFLRARRRHLAEVLERLGQEIDLPQTHYERAEQAYNAVAEWLAGSNDRRLATAHISAHGSIRLQTAIRHRRGKEFDVDLICLLPQVTPSTPPSVVKRLIGARLFANERYAGITVEKNRCWQIQYRGDFHLDVTPAIYNPGCPNGGLLVPDKDRDCWKATHPFGYAELFEFRSKLQGQFRLAKFAESRDARAGIEALPDQQVIKGLLRRGVQLIKWNRDIYFSTRDESVAPISIVQTTLLAWSYQHAVRARAYDDELELLLESIRGMPNFIQMRPDGYWIPNETTQGENFAEKWNTHPRRAEAFYVWHAQAVATIEKAVELGGEDELAKHLGEGFGRTVVDAAFNQMNAKVEIARQAGRLGLGAAGLVADVSSAVASRPHTFFGQ